MNLERSSVLERLNGEELVPEARNGLHSHDDLLRLARLQRNRHLFDRALAHPKLAAACPRSAADSFSVTRHASNQSAPSEQPLSHQMDSGIRRGSVDPSRPVNLRGFGRCLTLTPPRDLLNQEGILKRGKAMTGAKESDAQADNRVRPPKGWNVSQQEADPMPLIS